MSCLTQISPEPAPSATLNASPAPPLPPSAPLATLPRTECPELTTRADRLASASQASTPPQTAHAFNPTATPIPSALNASKVSSSACSASPPRTESSSCPRAFAFAWTDTTPTPTIPVCLVLQAVELADQLLTALLAWLWLLPLAMVPAPAPTRPTSLFLLTV